jgi:hypothetical protein
VPVSVIAGAAICPPPPTGRPAWQVLAGAMPGRSAATEVFYADAPFGVFYLAAWLSRSA